MASTITPPLPFSTLSLSPTAPTASAAPRALERAPPLPPRPPTRAAIRYTSYTGEDEIPVIMGLVDSELSEPYNFYTYRYFLMDWPHLCFMAYDNDVAIGTIVCKQEQHRSKLDRGYLAMLSTRKEYRGLGVATQLVRLAISTMLQNGCEEVVLETEYDNEAALGFYRKLGFVKEKRLYRFYLNAKDAFRLKLILPKLPRKEDLQKEGGEESVEERIGRERREVLNPSN